MYGLFFASRAVERWHYVYRRDGFRDKTVKFDDRFAKAIEYLERAEPLLRDAGQFDLLTGVYYNMAFVLNATGQHDRACASFGRSLDAYQQNVARNPTATPNTGGFASVPAAIEDGKRRVGCQ